MKLILFAVLLLAMVSFSLFAQNIGIGIARPVNNLHVFSGADASLKVETSGINHGAGIWLKTRRSSNDLLQLEKWVSGSTGTLAGLPLSNLSTVISGADAGPLLTGTLGNTSLYFTTNNAPRLHVTQNGNVGIGLTNPDFRLEVYGRSRIRHNGETAGVWFNSSDNSFTSGFVGMQNDYHTGFYGYLSGWSFLMNVNSGNVSMGSTVPGSAKLTIQAENGNALEVSGAIKVSGGMPPAFQVKANINNLSDPNADGYFTSVIIDNSLCNNDPAALLFVIPAEFTHEVPIQVNYDVIRAKWKIVAHSTYRLSDKQSVQNKAVSFHDGQYACNNENNLAKVNLFFGFVDNDLFNILVVKR